jgi:preprotein translocase subunit SecB
MSEENPQAGANQAPQQQFGIQKIYLKDCSYETADVPAVFLKKWEPEIDVQIGSNASHYSDDNYGVVLSVTVTAKLEDKTAFLVEVQQAGIFGIKGFGDKEMGYMLGSFCPNILFPFAREALASLVSKGGFRDLYLNPVNFDVLYAERVAKMEAESAATESP